MEPQRLVGSLCPLLFAACLSTPALAQDDPPPVPGEVQGAGYHFEITDSDYLNVTLDSSAEVDVHLHSMGETILIGVAAAAGAPSTQLTLSGLAPSTTYYLRADGPDEESFTSDVDGTYVFTQDLAEPRLLVIQATSGTYYIRPSRNDCSLFGTWDAATNTCTLTQDISDMIVIDNMPGMTLDGNGFRVTPFYSTWPIDMWFCDDCTVKNLDMDAYYGPFIHRSNRVTIADNTIRTRHYGFYLNASFDLTITGNTLNGWYPSFYPVFFSWSDRAEVTGNSFNGFGYGFYFKRADYNAIYNNNFGSYLRNPIGWYYYSFGNAFYRPLPDGGNWWGRYDDPAEGCHDLDGNRCCDARYSLGWGMYDELPWTDQDAWANQAPVADAGPDRTLEASCSNADRTSPVGLDGSGSYDPDGDALSYSWEGPTCPTTTGMTPDVDLDLGAHTITLTVDDGRGGSDTDDMVVTLQDTTAPEVTAPTALDVACTQVSAEGLGQCPAADPAVADWLASAAVSDACDPVPTMTDDCPSILGVDTTTVTFTGTDFEGNAGIDSAAVQVLYGWGGFQPPIRNDGETSIKQTKRGRTIPVKFTIHCGGTTVSAAVASIAVYKVLDTDTGSVDETDMTSDSGNSGDGGNLFRYDAVDQQYIFNLSTKGYDAPATYQIQVTLNDGTVKIVNFSLRR